MKIIRWDTPISDYRLDFKGLTDIGKTGIFKVETNSGSLFEVVLENTDDGVIGPYVIVEEEHMTNYWNLKTKGRGSTFIIEPSYLLNHFIIILEPEKYKHYVVATSGICLEVLSQVPPVVRQVER